MEVAEACPAEHGKSKTAFRMLGTSNHADSERQNAKNGDFGKYESGSFTAYAWFVWQKGYKGKPMLDWVNVGKDMPREAALF